MTGLFINVFRAMWVWSCARSRFQPPDPKNYFNRGVQMIPSFYPVRDKLDADAKERAHRNLSPTQLEILRGGRPQPLVDRNSGLETRTISQLLASSRRVRYPDAPHFSYADLLAGEAANQNSSPFTANGVAFWNAGNRPRIAVIGGGMSGLLSAWQLGKLGAVVDLWEAGAPPSGNAGIPNGAGRIRPVNVVPNDPNTRVELGAMRFPDTSHLFWHYLSLVLPNLTQFTEFPNPGKIPTYLSGETTLSATWDRGGLGLDALGDNGLNYAALQQRHLSAFLNVQANGLTLNQVSSIMLSGTANLAQLNQVEGFWGIVSGSFHHITYRQFLEQRFNQHEIRAIGFIGLGTGGFSPLFDTSVLDVMRLVVWNYAAEYAVPDLLMYPFQLRQRVASSNNGGSFNYFSQIRGAIWEASSGRYFLVQSNGTTTPTRYDYVVLAMSHRAAENFFTGTGVTATPPNRRPYSTERSSEFRYDIQFQQRISSVKIFQAAGGPAGNPQGQFGLVNPLLRNYDRFVRAIFGMAGNIPVGVTYILPRLNENFASARLVMGLQYSWGIDSVRVRNEFLVRYPNLNALLNTTGTFSGRDTNPANGVAEILDNRVRDKRTRNQVINGRTHPNFFSPTRSQADGQEGHLAIVDWDRVPHINMGFKLDAPNRGLRSIYQFRLTAQTDGEHLTGTWDVGNRVDVSTARIYFCGCSFSHYGGWVEGAFQSALNATAGIVYDEARRTHQLNRLSMPAKELVLGRINRFQAGRDQDHGKGKGHEHDHASQS
ncbi:FAD-dependent oxidoreductase [Aquincola sp. MAHUQ-54]|uniref:FAD-dependent oxidoreductase n=1 Tax=Aquincola agrisoli TaxID=3119538 RepID=A0AAW9QDX2_9BURK